MATTVTTIPIINLTSASPEADTARQLLVAAETMGFVYIGGHDIPQTAVDSMFKLSEDFFLKTSEEVKKEFAIGKDNRGWSGVLTEKLDPKTQKIGDTKEAFNFGEFIGGTSPKVLPLIFSQNEEQIHTFFQRCRTLCNKILRLLAIALDIPEDFFTSAHDPSKGPSGTTLRLLHYPPSTENPHNDSGIRAGAHSDYGTCTLLFRLPGQAGLEILTPTNTWAPVPVHPPGTDHLLPPPILMNIGDLLSYWTNGVLCSTVHRVTTPPSPSPSTTTTNNSNEEKSTDKNGPTEICNGEIAGIRRFSMAFFSHPVYETRLEPVPSRRVMEHGELVAKREGNEFDKRKVLTANEHLAMRLARTYVSVYGKVE